MNAEASDLKETRPRYERLAAVQEEQTRRQQPDLARNLRIVESLYDEAVTLGAFPPADPLPGIEADLRVARAFNV